MYQSIVDLLNTYLFRNAASNYEWGSYICQVGGAILTLVVLAMPFYIAFKIASRWI